MKRITTLCLLLALSAGPAFAETISQVAAIINDDIITTFQLNKALDKEREANNLGDLTEEAAERLKSQVLEGMIDEKLFYQRVHELGISVRERELEAAIDDVQHQNNLTRDQLISALQAQGMDFAAYRKKLEKELLHYRLISQEVNGRVEVTNKEVREYFREHIDEYLVEPTIHLKRISFNIPTGATEQQKAAVKELAEAVRDKLTIEKQAFDVVLATLGNSADGDDMGTLEEGSLLPVFQESLKRLNGGEVTEPIAANGRLHLFFVVARNPGDSNLFDKVKGEIVDILREKNTEKRFVEWTQELRDQANIEILL